MKSLDFKKFVFETSAKWQWLHMLIYGKEIKARIKKLEDGLRAQQTCRRWEIALERMRTGHKFHLAQLKRIEKRKKVLEKAPIKAGLAEAYITDLEFKNRLKNAAYYSLGKKMIESIKPKFKSSQMVEIFPQYCQLYDPNSDNKKIISAQVVSVFMPKDGQAPIYKARYQWDGKTITRIFPEYQLMEIQNNASD